MGGDARAAGVFGGVVEVFEGLGTFYGRLWRSDVWGILDAGAGALVRPDQTVRLDAPAAFDGPVLEGQGWRLELDPAWRVVPAARAGDLRLERRE